VFSASVQLKRNKIKKARSLSNNIRGNIEIGERRKGVNWYGRGVANNGEEEEEGDIRIGLGVSGGKSRSSNVYEHVTHAVYKREQPIYKKCKEENQVGDALGEGSARATARAASSSSKSKIKKLDK